MYNIHEDLDELKILFGVLNNKCLDLVNHMILIGKQVIYLCRSKKIKPAFDIFLTRLSVLLKSSTTLHKGEKL